MAYKLKITDIQGYFEYSVPMLQSTTLRSKCAGFDYERIKRDQFYGQNKGVPHYGHCIKPCVSHDPGWMVKTMGSRRFELLTSAV
jgi:hypothetical protein